MPLFSRVASTLSLASVAYAAVPIPNIIPLFVDGALDSCTVDNAGQFNSGGFISVNGIQIKVPENLIAQFPVAWAPFPQLCDAEATGFEVSVFGNYVNGQAIAGQIIVSVDFLAEANTGYIESISIPDGSMKIRGGPTIRINDPNAVFSKGTTENPLFTADDENPSISAFSGFPMCIPRSDDDDLCPSSNRPAGTTNFIAPDPLVMAPFLVGDYIEYSGHKLPSGEILAWEITAINVQIRTTASNTVPNYIRVEDAIIAIFDDPPAGNVELGFLRFIGFLSDCNGASVSIFAIDVDPCTGDETHRQIGSATPRPLANDARCKWEFRADVVSQSTYTREYYVQANNPVITTKNGIEAGQYTTPVTEWVQPEVDVPGTEPPPFRFRDIRGLVEGDFLDDQQFGPLNPFPGPDPPAPSQTCTSGPGGDPDASPVASAAPIAAVKRVGASILLEGKNTAAGISNSALTFEWTKTSPDSPDVSLESAASPTASFVAPSVTAQTTFTFQLKVSSKADPSKSSTADVEVKISPSAVDSVTLDSYTWIARQSGTISVGCHSDVVNGDVTRMSLLLSDGATTLNMVPGAGPGRFTYDSRSTKQPTNVQCVSNLGGKSLVVTQTTSRRRRGELGLDTMSRAEWM